ncbi:MAG: MBL fold metallo-hydrolase [Nitrospirae bacterium]|nr:MBL fold metallo-hydrolase [Nitrospirota bacterium]
MKILIILTAFILAMLITGCRDVELKPFSPPIVSGQLTRMYVFNTGKIQFPYSIFYSKEEWGEIKKLFPDKTKDEKVWLSVPTYLLEYSDGSFIAINPGLPSISNQNPSKAFGFVFSKLFSVKVDEGKDLYSQMQAHHLDIRKLKAMIFTHLHIGDISGLIEVKKVSNTMFYTVNEEWQAVQKSFGIFKGYRFEYFKQIDKIYGLAFKTSTDFSPFSEACNFLGDNSIIIFKTPGHSQGHLSFLIQGKDKSYLIPAGAAKNFPSFSYLQYSWSEEKSKESVNNLKEFKAKHPHVKFLMDHDPFDWEIDDFLVIDF